MKIRDVIGRTLIKEDGGLPGQIDPDQDPVILNLTKQIEARKLVIQQQNAAAAATAQKNLATTTASASATSNAGTGGALS